MNYAFMLPEIAQTLIKNEYISCKSVAAKHYKRLIMQLRQNCILYESLFCLVFQYKTSTFSLKLNVSEK